MAYLTDQHLKDYGLDPDASATRQVLADAGSVYDQVGASPWITPGELAKWSEGEWGDGAPDRLNAAVEFLLRANRIVDLGAVPRQNPVTGG